MRLPSGAFQIPHLGLATEEAPSEGERLPGNTSDLVLEELYLIQRVSGFPQRRFDLLEGQRNFRGGHWHS